MDTDALTKNLPSLLGLVVLLFILMFLMANFGYIRACEIPGFSSVYYSIKGQPRIALISGDDGYGDPEKLREIIISRTNYFAEELPVESLKTGGVLDQYQLVIVTRAKTIDTSSLQAFRDYVQKGGRLIWIGDAGTGLGKNDFICTKVDFAYIRAAEYTDPVDNSTFIQCGDWQYYSPDDPIELKSGICGKDYAEMVFKYHKLNKSIYESAFRGELMPCPDVDSSFDVRNAERLQECIIKLRGDVSLESIEEKCTYKEIKLGTNYWNRGATYTDAGRVVSAFNFGATVLGMDYVASLRNQSIYLQSVDPSHPLIRGYTIAEVPTYFLEANFSLVDTTGFEMRSKTIMVLREGQITRPAVVVSSPVGPVVAKGGLVVYYAFPPEDLIKYEDGMYKGALNLIDNLINYMIC